LCYVASLFVLSCVQNQPSAAPRPVTTESRFQQSAPVPISPTPSASSPSTPLALCTPTSNQQETAELHRLVSETTQWSGGQQARGKTQNLKILGFNDFHGQLSPPPPLDGRPLGGAAVLASYFREAASGVEGATLVVHAGDLIGASPPESALNQDEPTVEFLGAILGPGCTRSERSSDSCHVVASLGNHEFDEGLTELDRIVKGGNHARGPFLGHEYRGAPFEYIAANVRDSQSHAPVVAPHLVKNLAGVRVGLVGAVLRDAPVFLLPSGINRVKFEDEVGAINAEVEELSKLGARTVVVVLHQGGYQCFAPGAPRDERSVTGPIVDIVKHLHPAVDVVVSGHTHSVLNALLPNSAGKPTLVTQAFHAGTGFAEIELTVDTATDDVIAKRARIVTPWADVHPGDHPVPQIAASVERALATVRPRTARIIGSVASTIHAPPDSAGNSELGNLIADAQKEAAGGDLAFTTPSWVRGDLQAGTITWGDLFRIQPFGNRLMRVELSGQQVIELLNQQWLSEDHPRILHAAGLTYRWDPKRPATDRVLQVQHAGKVLEPKRRYGVIVNEYLAEGGDGFSLLARVPRKPTKLLDIDALEQYVRKHSPLAVDPEKRIQRQP
jgi:5'-nucleotidase